MPRSTASRATIDTGSFVLNPDEPRPAHVSFVVSDERSRAYASLAAFCGRSPAYVARHFRRAQPRLPIARCVLRAKPRVRCSPFPTSAAAPTHRSLRSAGEAPRTLLAISDERSRAYPSLAAFCGRSPAYVARHFRRAQPRLRIARCVLRTKPRVRCSPFPTSAAAPTHRSLRSADEAPRTLLAISDERSRAYPSLAAFCGRSPAYVARHFRRAQPRLRIARCVLRTKPRVRCSPFPTSAAAPTHRSLRSADEAPRTLLAISDERSRAYPSLAAFCGRSPAYVARHFRRAQPRLRIARCVLRTKPRVRCSPFPTSAAAPTHRSLRSAGEAPRTLLAISDERSRAYPSLAAFCGRSPAYVARHFRRAQPRLPIARCVLRAKPRVRCSPFPTSAAAPTHRSLRSAGEAPRTLLAISYERSRAYRSLSPTTRAVLELRLNETTRLLQDRHDVGRRRSRGRLPAVGRADPAARGAERADRARRRDVFRDRVP